MHDIYVHMQGVIQDFVIGHVNHQPGVHLIFILSYQNAFYVNIIDT